MWLRTMPCLKWKPHAWVTLEETGENRKLECFQGEAVTVAFKQEVYCAYK